MDKIYIIFDVNGQRLKRNNPNLITVGGSYGLVKAKFNLQGLSAWVYCDSIVASFKSESFGPISYTIDSLTNECFVPQEVLKERWFDVTLSGYEGTEIKITSTAVRNEYLGRFEDTSAIPEEPIPDIYAQFLRDILTKGDRVVFANGFLSLYSGDTELSKTPIAGGGEASQIQLRVFDGWIQSSYVSESPVWVNLISLSELEGPAGYTPIKGVDYFDGLKGDPGTPGLKGDPGDNGYTPIKGVDYFDGLKGDPGTPGLKGDPGDDGYTPIKGVDYFDGLKGDPGTPGLKGDPGDNGYTPIKGVDYFDGLKGDPGTPGLKGDPGDDGYTPIKGVDYFDGLKGDPGTPGLKGDPGDNGYTPIKGVDYFDGLKGDPGTPGLKGDPGDDGYTPIKGVDYFDGLKGDPGTPGLKGDPGDNGYTPIKGVDYFDGLKGDKGDPGTTLYSELTDKPSINNVELSGNKTLDNLGIMKKNSGVIVPDAATLNAELSVGVVTKIETLNTCTSLTITLGAGNWWDEYKVIFTTGVVAPAVSFPASITRWVGGTPTIAANKRYEVSILDGTGVVTSV